MEFRGWRLEGGIDTYSAHYNHAGTWWNLSAGRPRLRQEPQLRRFWIQPKLNGSYRLDGDRAYVRCRSGDEDPRLRPVEYENQGELRSGSAMLACAARPVPGVTTSLRQAALSPWAPGCCSRRIQQRLLLGGRRFGAAQGLGRACRARGPRRVDGHRFALEPTRCARPRPIRRTRSCARVVAIAGRQGRHLVVHRAHSNAVYPGTWLPCTSSTTDATVWIPAWLGDLTGWCRAADAGFSRRVRRAAQPRDTRRRQRDRSRPAWLLG